MAIAVNPYSSTHPAIDALFAREFAGRQLDQAAAEAAAARAVQRDQIRAQQELAQSQLQASQRQQEMSNLFRMEQAREQNRQVTRQLDIDEEYKKGILAKPPATTTTDAERRKAAIIDANANAVNDAARANALYKIALDAEIARAKEKDVGWFGGALGGTKPAQFDDLNDPLRKALNKKVFDSVWAKLISEKSGAVQSVLPDPETFTFKPVQYDDNGKAIALPLPSPTSQSNPAGLGLMTPPESVEEINIDRYRAPRDLSAFSSVPVEPIGAAADMFKIGTPAPAAPQTQTVRRPFGTATILISPTDDADLARQLLAIPAEQRPAAYRNIVDQWLRAGRASLVTPPATQIPTEPEINSPRY